MSASIGCSILASTGVPTMSSGSDRSGVSSEANTELRDLVFGLFQRRARPLCRESPEMLKFGQVTAEVFGAFFKLNGSKVPRNIKKITRE